MFTYLTPTSYNLKVLKNKNRHTLQNNNHINEIKNNNN